MEHCAQKILMPTHRDRVNIAEITSISMHCIGMMRNNIGDRLHIADSMTPSVIFDVCLFHTEWQWMTVGS